MCRVTRFVSAMERGNEERDAAALAQNQLTDAQAQQSSVGHAAPDMGSNPQQSARQHADQHQQLVSSLHQPAQQHANQSQEVRPSLEELAQQTGKECTDIMSSTMKQLADSGITQVLPPSNPSVLHIIGAAMTPVVHGLLQQKAVLVHEKMDFQQRVGQLQQQVTQLQTQLSSVQEVMHTMRKQQMSDATFPPLMAIALAQCTQQLHGLARFLAAGHSSAKRGLAAGQFSPSSSPRAVINTPQRKQVQARQDARAIAKKQLEKAGQRLGSLDAGPSRPNQTAAAVLTRPVTNGWQIV